MAEETPAPPAKPATKASADVPPAKVRKKKLRPTNCAQSNKRIRRKDWYYRNGLYFANKQCFKAYVVQQKEKKAKEAASAAAAAAPAERPAGLGPADGTKAS